MTAAIFSDLDGTLIYSKRFIHDTADVVEIESISGAPSAWMTTAAAEKLRAARDNAHFVPTSTRVFAQYERLRLPGGPAEYAILANGGRIYRDGVEDLEWTARVNDASWGVGKPAGMVTNLERTLTGQNWVRQIVHFDNIVCITAHRGFTPHDGFFDMAMELAEENGYTSFPQGRKTHLIPSHITKEAAAAEVAARLGAPRTFASGDHKLDCGLMLWADDAIQPAHGVGLDGVPSTGESGVRAAEEITAEFLRFASAPQGSR